ncbi:MAG: DUF6481 family protein [Sphingomonas sp.]
MAYKEPTFQDRAALSAQAKQRALEKLKTKPVVDPAIAAERAARREAKETAETERRAAKKAEQEQLRLDKIAKAEAAEREAKERVEAAEREKNAAADRTKQSLLDAKAARDSRYAARKARK